MSSVVSEGEVRLFRINLDMVDLTFDFDKLLSHMRNLLQPAELASSLADVYVLYYTYLELAYLHIQPSKLAAGCYRQIYRIGLHNQSFILNEIQLPLSAQL